MSYPTIAAAVIMERTALQNRWQSETWQAAGVVPDREPQGSPARLLHEEGARARWLHPGFMLRLFTDEAEGYYLNLSSPSPFVFINWEEQGDLGVPKSVTVSYNEAARMMDGGARVDGVPMPGEWVPWLAEFVRLHYRPEPKEKRIRPPSFKGARRDES